MGKLKVKPQTENANKHSPYGLGLLETSIGRDGWIDAITVAADDESISGSARIEVGATKGWDFAHEEPLVIQAPDDRPLVVETTGKQPLINRRVDIPNADHPMARRLSVAANQITAVDWVPDAAVLEGWAASDDAIKGLFTDDSWASLLAGVGGGVQEGGGGDDFDGAPAVDGPTRTAVGDLWSISGNGLTHRLIVGDCTDPLIVEQLMGEERADMTWADPPFGIEYTGHGESVDGRANKFSPIAGDDAPSGDWLPFWLPKDAGALYLKTTWKVLHEWERILSEIIRIRSRIVWDKCSHVAGDVVGGYATQTEIVLFASVGRHTINSFDTDHWSIPRATTGAPELRSGHPYESPVALIDRAIQNSTRRGALVVDPFLGSGTAIVAAHHAGRRCFGCEIEPRWADTCLRRAEAAGLTCTRE